MHGLYLISEQPKIRGAVFVFRLEVSRAHLVRGIVNPSQQSEMRCASFQPSMPATIDLEKHSFLRPALAARTILWSTALLRRPDPGLARNPQMTIVEARVLAPRQLDHLLPNIFGNRVARYPLAVAVMRSMSPANYSPG
jgi:hypothetical protein